MNQERKLGDVFRMDVLQKSACSGVLTIDGTVFSTAVDDITMR